MLPPSSPTSACIFSWILCSAPMSKSLRAIPDWFVATTTL